MRTGSKPTTIEGRRFGRLLVVKLVRRWQHKSLSGVASISTWECLCDCGNTIIARRSNLADGRTQSCGCARSLHAMSVPGYTSYKEAKKRCNNPNSKSYAHYGGRGIEFRFNSFEEFFSELGKKPTPLHSIDRIDNDGHYEKGNVRWATNGEQAQNKKRTSENVSC